MVAAHKPLVTIRMDCISGHSFVLRYREGRDLKAIEEIIKMSDRYGSLMSDFACGYMVACVRDSIRKQKWL